jgi:glucan 1,3-beta-glucosidase
MPADPRQAVGKCSQIGSDIQKPDGQYESWQTGGAGAGTFAAAATAGFDYPPNLNGVPVDEMPFLATYTNTGTVPTLPPTSFTASMTKSVDPGDGWYNSADTAGGVTTVAGCPYPPDAWDALDAPIPAAACPAGGAAAPTVAARAIVAAMAARTAPPIKRAT